MARPSSKDIALNLLKCCVVFYAGYYVIGSLCFAAYRLQHFDGKIPFNFKTWINISECCMDYSDEQMVNFLSMEFGFLAIGICYGFVVQRWPWDHALTVTLLHVLLCCAVMVDFPLNWSWWVSLALALVLQVVASESIAFLLRRKFHSKVGATSSTEITNYLFRKK